MTKYITRRTLVVAVVAIVFASVATAIYTTSGTTSTTFRVTTSSITASHSTSFTTSSSSTSSTPATSTSETTSSSIFTSSSTLVSISSESVNNTCITHSYNSSINTISAIYYECSATLNAGQSFKEFIIRPAQLNGSFNLSVNGSQPIQVQVVDNGTIVFSDNGTYIKYSGSASVGELLSITVTNSELSLTAYDLGLDWTSV